MDGIHETELYASLAFLIDTIANRMPDPAEFREAYRAMLGEFVPGVIARVGEGRAVLAELAGMPAGGDLQMIITASR
ncbi:hypothetical protein ACFZCK_13975 [Kitasatospora purpeofusca]|uniref:hypothetical protein n=1 Tax=Kitasatospora purpeofusca TaxID=67352 RepID=UPI0036F13DD3